MTPMEIKTGWTNIVREEQMKLKWAGKIVERGGRVYAILAETATAMNVRDVVANQEEDWDRAQFLSIGLRVVESAPRECQEHTCRIAEIETAIKSAVSRLLDKVRNV